MKKPLLLLLLMSALNACSNNDDNRVTPDTGVTVESFMSNMKTMVSTAPETTEPDAADVVTPAPETNEPEDI